MPRGYGRAPYILPFDHRSSVQSKLFGWKPPLSDAQTAEIAATKRVIYDGLGSVLAGGYARTRLASWSMSSSARPSLEMLRAEGVVTARPAEKSGRQ